MTWRPTTKGNHEHCYLQVDLCFARVLWTGMADVLYVSKHLHLNPKVAN